MFKVLEDGVKIHFEYVASGGYNTYTELKKLLNSQKSTLKKSLDKKPMSG